MAVVRAQEASSSTFRYAYHVFLSFRGEDTRKTFTDHLYSALVQIGFRTFRDDDEIERGKRLELELRKAMQQSRISISGTETIEGLVLDMQMYKDDAFNVTIGKKGSYYETCDTIFPSNYGSSFRRRYFNFLSAEPSIDVSFNYDAFSRMDKLKLLKLNYAKLSGRCEKFPEGLRWLCWHGFPLKFIPSDLPLGNLVSLDMSYSKLKHVWAGNKVLLSLKILNFSHSQRLVKTPNFIGLPNLERLILRGCASLVEVCDTIANLGRLALLNLENCKSLRNFPNVGMLNSLQTLVLDGCLNIIGEYQKWLAAME
ncbi:hypothetical protein LguiB_005262 [Lonicera macranthoides]